VVRKYSCRMQKRVGASRDDFSTAEEEAAGAEVQVQAVVVRREERPWMAGLTGRSRAKNATKHAYRVWRVGMGGDGWATASLPLSLRADEDIRAQD
jgi:hypothetical protein